MRLARVFNRRGRLGWVRVNNVNNRKGKYWLSKKSSEQQTARDSKSPGRLAKVDISEL